MEEQQEEPWDPNSLQYECAVCLRDFITAENEPVSIDGKPQCVRCLEEELKPVADGHEAAGLPKRGEQLLTDFPGVLDRINQDLRRRYEEIATRMAEVPILQRVYCRNQIDGSSCHAYLGKRTAVAEDKTHQWRACTECIAQICQVCEAVQTDDNRMSVDCALPRWARHYVSEEMLLSDRRGVEFQICPACHIPTERPTHCNQITCNCEISYCFICGKRAAIDGEHWMTNRGGCPRMYQPDKPNAWGDNPWGDWQNFGGIEFPPLKPGNSQWQDSAEVIAKLDRDIRLWHRIDVEAEDSTVSDLHEFLVHARQLSAMVSNRENSAVLGLVYRTPHPHQVLERFRFAHHACYFRYWLQDIYLSEDHHVLPIASNLPWFKLFRAVRRLRFRAAEESHEGQKNREIDFSALLPLLEDRLYDIESGTANSDDLPEAEKRKRRLTIGILRSCSTVLTLVWRHAGGANTFSASLSFYLLRELDKLQGLLDESNTDGDLDFRGTGADQVFAFDIGVFFLYRMFEEEPDEVNMTDEFANEPLWARERVWVDDMKQVLSEVRIEQPWAVNQVEGGKLLRLEEHLDGLRKTLAVCAPSPDADVGEASYSLLEAIEASFNNLVTGGTNPYPRCPEGVLRPLFHKVALTLDQVLIVYDVSARSIPREQVTQRMRDWHELKRIVRNVQVESLDTPMAPDRFRLLLLVRRLAFTVARVDYPDLFRDIEKLSKVKLMRHYRELCELLSRSNEDGSRNPPVLWFGPLQRHNDLVRLINRMTPILRQVAGMRALEVAPPEDEDGRVWGRTRIDWNNDSIFMNRLWNAHQGWAAHHGVTADQTAQGQVLALVRELIPRILSYTWEAHDEVENPQRVQTLRAFCDRFAQWRAHWQPPLLLPNEWPRIGQVVRHVLGVLERLFPTEQGVFDLGIPPEGLPPATGGQDTGDEEVADDQSAADQADDGQAAATGQGRDQAAATGRDQVAADQAVNRQATDDQADIDRASNDEGASREVANEEAQ